MTELSFKNFTTNQEAIETLLKVESVIPDILAHPELMKTSRIIHDEPEVWRIWWQLGDIRVAFHKIFPCEECFFHPHPWPSIVKCLKGGYTHTIGIYNGSPNDVMCLRPDDIKGFSDTLLPFVTTVSKGDHYRMVDIRQFHQVTTPDYSYSIMIMGQPYFKGATKAFSRKSPDQNIELSKEQIDDILSIVKSYYL